MRSERRDKFGKRAVETLKKTLMKTKAEKSKDKEMTSLYTGKNLSAGAVLPYMVTVETLKIFSDDSVWLIFE